MKKIGIMGGTFNPPHFGHLLIAECAIERLGLDRVVFMPNGKVAYKKQDGGASGLDRYNMLKTVTDENEKFELSDIELNDDGITYTANTLTKLKGGEYANSELYFLVGADSLDYMDRWYEPKRIFELCTVAVAVRAGFDRMRIEEKMNELKARFSARIVGIEMPCVDISSTVLRERIRQGRSIRYLTDEKIIEYIDKHKLYI